MKVTKINNQLPCKLFIIVGVLLTQASVISIVEAKIFKCTNKQGAVYYNDKPCPVDDDEKKINNEKDVVNGYVPPGFKRGDARQAQGTVVGERGSRSIENNPDRVEKEKMTSGSPKSGSPKNGGFQSDKSRSQGADISDGLQQNNKKTFEKNVNLDPPKPKIKKSASGGKLSIAEKRTMLGIYPVHR